MNIQKIEHLAKVAASNVYVAQMDFEDKVQACIERILSRQSLCENKPARYAFVAMRNYLLQLARKNSEAHVAEYCDQEAVTAEYWLVDYAPAHQQDRQRFYAIVRNGFCVSDAAKDLCMCRETLQKWWERYRARMRQVLNNR